MKATPLIWLACCLSMPPMKNVQAQVANAVHISDPEVARQVADFFGPGATGSYRARNGMVTSASMHATAAGLEILRAGGNAFEAAVAVQLALTVAEPYASGIGGGLLCVAWDAGKKRTFTLDAREEAPEATGLERFQKPDGSFPPFREMFTGANAAGVPGTVAACHRLLREHGSMTLAQVAAPAIRLAREGFPIPEIFAANLAAHWDRLQKFPETARLFESENGGPLRQGERHRNPALADTLERLAKVGAEDFYTGEIARDLVDSVRADPVNPGVMSPEDLAGYRAVEREPLEYRFGEWTLRGMRTPSAGGVTLGMMLGLLERSDFDSQPLLSAGAIVRLVDAQNVAFADRDRWLGDADFADVPLRGLLDAGYLEERAKLMGGDKAAVTPVKAGMPPGATQAHAAPAGSGGESESTTHFTVVDQFRNIVCVTSTIEQHFGCGVTVRGRGFLLNNQLTDFNIRDHMLDGEPSPNRIEGGRRPRRGAAGADKDSPGGKRPRSSMTPTIVFRDGEPVLALGSPGGSRITGVTLNVLLNILSYGMDPQQAVNLPRVIARNGAAELETPLFRDEPLRRALEERGLKVVDAQAAGCVQVVLLGADGWLLGAADPRREGMALGY
jgi:gamma-glutamyltranspeptidase/glutathione hydrolase